MKHSLIAFVLFIVLTAGVGMMSAVHGQTNASSTSSTTVTGSQSSAALNSAFKSKSSNLRLNLNTLLREHAAMGGVTLAALYAGADTSRLMQLMVANKNQLDKIVETTYGTEVSDSFDTLWSAHMDEYEKYTLARKKDDTKGMDKAKQNLQTISDKMGQLFDDAGNNLTAGAVSKLMDEHIDGTLSLVDAVDEKNATKSANLMNSNYNQAGRFADTLSRGMIQDKPNVYPN